MAEGISVICGDAVEEMRKIPSRSINLIVTDPPYNLSKNYGNNHDSMEFDEYLMFSRAWLTEAKRVLTDDGSIYTFMGMRFISYLYVILEKEMELFFNSWITWHYTQGIGKTRGYSPRHDDILFFTKNKENFTFNLDAIRIPQKYYRARNNMKGANPGNVWEIPHIHYCSPARRAHPTQKPEALFLRMIMASSNEGDMVLDPFMGSGTSLSVCRHTGRRGIGIDIKSEYVSMTMERLEEPFEDFDSSDARGNRIPRNAKYEHAEQITIF